MSQIQAVFIGASAGGVTAILKLLEFLPENYALPLVIAQHLPRDSQVQVANVFGQKRAGRVLEVLDKMPIEPGKVYFAPADYHLLIETGLLFSLSQDELVNYSRPSIDVLFESAAVAFGASACGVLLTGGNEDGAKGIREIQRLGGITMVQDPAEAECATMPNSALEIMQPDYVGGISGIAKKLMEFAEGAR